MKHQILPFTYGCLVLIFCWYLVENNLPNLVVDVVWASVIGATVVTVAIFFTRKRDEGESATH